MNMKNFKHLFKENVKQIIYVFVAFSLMVLVSYWSMGTMVRGHLFKSATDNLTWVESNILLKLREPEIALFNASFTITDMIEKGASQNMLSKYLIDLTECFLETEGSVSGFDGAYAYLRGEYMNGLLWDPPVDFAPTERPWYLAAINNDGDIAVTEPYVDVRTGEVVISFSQEIFGSNNEAYGVCAFDVKLNYISEDVIATQLANGGYGIMLSPNMYIVSHPNADMLGKHLSEIDGEYGLVEKELLNTGSILGKRIWTEYGGQSVVFFRQIFNGWYIGTITPVESYYKDVYSMAIVLSMLGFVLMIFLSSVLLRLSAERAKSDEKNKLKSKFLARMSHEIRTPMNAIIGMSELALRSNDMELSNKYVVEIRKSGQNLLSIINDILDISKIESGMLRLANEKYMLAAVINDAVNIIRVRLSEKPILFAVNVDANIPGTLVGDETHVRQILLNLLSNGVKYTSEGFLTLKVTGEVHNNEVILSFIVTDSGIGIKEEDIGRLFDNFVRVDLENNKGIEGTGLGLAISQNLCRAMGGQITVTTEYGKGSTFTAVFKQKVAHKRELAKIESPETKSILLLEERQLYAKSILETAENLGVTAKRALNEAEFINELISGEYAFAFIPPSVAAKADEVVIKHNINTELVKLVEIEDTEDFDNMTQLSLPVYASPVANILNGVTVVLTDAYSEISFIAPCARILVVDDFAANLQVAEGLLAPYRVKVDKCLSGQKALKLIRENEYDIIFMDHMMPGMDGIQALEAIRDKLEANNQHLTVIALTANAISGMREMFLEKGFDDYLAKPVEISKLNEIMEKWIPALKRMPIRKRIEEKIVKANFSIDGVNADRGLMLSGGTPEKYLSVLQHFCADASARSEEIGKMNLQDEISLFTTYAHALKSMLAVVGAEELSKVAAKLEASGKKKDLGFINSNLLNFLSELNVLIESISSVIHVEKQTEEVSYDSNLASSEYIGLELFLSLKDAIQNDDILEIDRLLEALSAMSLGAEEKKVFTEINDAVLISDFSKAVEIIDTISPFGGTTSEF